MWGMGPLATSVSSTVGEFLGNLDGVFGGTVGSWLADRLGETISLLGIQPADMRLRKPVTVNSQDVLDKGGLEGTGTVRTLVEALPESGSVMGLREGIGHLDGRRVWADDNRGQSGDTRNRHQHSPDRRRLEARGLPEGRNAMSANGAWGARSGQMAVELAVLVPVVLVVALVGVNLMEFMALCARFDRACLDAVVSHGVSPAGEQSQVGAVDEVREALSLAMAARPAWCG